MALLTQFFDTPFVAILLDINLGKAFIGLSGKLQRWIDHMVLLLPNILLAALFMIGFWLLAKGIRTLVRRVMRRFSSNGNIIGLTAGGLYVVTLIIGIFVALSILKLDQALTSLLAGAGIIGIALSFAFQDIAANFMSGILIAMRRPYTIGDLVETNTHFGRVERITLQNTQLLTMQGQLVVLPNRGIIQNPLLNFSYTGERRVDMDYRVLINADLVKVESIIQGAIVNIPFFNRQKPVEVYFRDFGESAIVVLIRFWITVVAEKDFLNAKSQAMKNVQASLAAAGMQVPFPVQNIHLVQPPPTDGTVGLK